MTDVPDPQPPAPEASVDALKRCYRCDSIETEERETFRTMDEARQWAKDRAAHIRRALAGKDAAA